MTINWKLAGHVGARVAACGMAVGLAMLLAFGGAITADVPAVWFVLAATAGAGLAGAICAGLFGRPGVSGASLAVLGAFLATGLGGIFAGWMVLPFRSLELVAVALIFAAVSPIGLLWGAMMLWVHFGTVALRGGRDEAK